MKPKASTVFTARGSLVKTRYALVEADSIVLSHDPVTLTPNEGYPRQLQPRDRSRIASEQQIEYMSRNLRPELLVESLSAAEGCPILGSDFVTESGNARGIAIIRAYNAGAASRYRKYIVAKCDELGLSRKKALSMTRPVIVRIRETRISRLRFVTEANEATVAAMSDAEQGRVDAGKITSALLTSFKPREDGELAHDGNLEFIRAFFDVVVSGVERGRYIDSEGYLSQQGAKRIRNAILAKALGDTEAGCWVIERIAESMDDNIRRISNAFIIAAPRLVALKQAIADGLRYPLDITGDLAAAMKVYSQLKARGTVVEDYIGQGRLYGEGVSPLEALILRVFQDSKKERAGLDALLAKYVALVHDLGNPNQLHLTTRPTPDKHEVFAAALEAVEKARSEAGEVDAPKRQRKRKGGLSLVTSEVAA